MFIHNLCLCKYMNTFLKCKFFRMYLMWKVYTYLSASMA